MSRVTLRHAIEIDAPPEAVYAFFAKLEQNYARWHPDHVVFRYTKGNPLEEGSTACTEQYLHGSLHRMKAKFTKVIPNRRIEFLWMNPLLRFVAPRNEWTFEADNGGCRFSAHHEFRLGWLSSRLDRVKHGLDATRKHLKEEGENLKRLVEIGGCTVDSTVD